MSTIKVVKSHEEAFNCVASPILGSNKLIRYGLIIAKDLKELNLIKDFMYKHIRPRTSYVASDLRTDVMTPSNARYSLGFSVEKEVSGIIMPLTASIQIICNNCDSVPYITVNAAASTTELIKALLLSKIVVA